MQAALLNARPLARAYVTHEQIARGGTLLLQMGDQPSEWGSTNPPPSLSLQATPAMKKGLRRQQELDR